MSTVHHTSTSAFHGGKLVALESIGVSSVILPCADVGVLSRNTLVYCGGPLDNLRWSGPKNPRAQRRVRGGSSTSEIARPSEVRGSSSIETRRVTDSKPRVRPKEEDCVDGTSTAVYRSRVHGELKGADGGRPEVHVGDFVDQWRFGSV